MTQAKQTEIYSNCSVLHPDGFLMFRCHRDRADWYLERDLAEIITEQPLVMKLKFVPAGLGNKNQPYYLAQKINRCVCCGTNEDLTKHHVVPRCYRKFFPEELKNSSSHDVLIVCVPCHMKYETHAMQRKIQLEHEYNIPITAVMDTEVLNLAKAVSAACALVSYQDKIPLARQEVLKTTIAEQGFKTDYESLCELAGSRKKRQRKPRREFTHGKLIVEKITDLEAFILMWRKDFIDTMDPQYLPELWSLDHRLQHAGEQ
jgi:hypothetical protein